MPQQITISRVDISGLIDMAHNLRTTLFTQTKAGLQQAELPSAFDVVYTERLNQPGTCSFRLPYTKLPDANGALTVPVANALEEGVHEVGIRRGGTVVWCGPVREIEETRDSAGQAGALTIVCAGLADYFWQWLITGKLPSTNAAGHFIAVDQATIAKALIDHHLAKGGGEVFGIDTTSITPHGVVRTRTEYDAYRGIIIGDALRDLGAVEGGFDWHINPINRKLVLSYPQRGQSRDDVTFNTANIVALGRRRVGLQQASAVFGIGDGADASTPTHYQSDSSAVSKYGLTEARVPAPSVSTKAVLMERVSTELAGRTATPNIISVTVRFGDNLPYGSFSVGDSVLVNFPSPWRDISERRRVIGIDIRPFPDETAVVHLAEDL